MADKPVALEFQIELEFGNVGFLRDEKTGICGEKPLAARARTNNKPNLHMTPRTIGCKSSHHCGHCYLHYSNCDNYYNKNDNCAAVFTTVFHVFSELKVNPK